MCEREREREILRGRECVYILRCLIDGLFFQSMSLLLGEFVRISRHRSPLHLATAAHLYLTLLFLPSPCSTSHTAVATSTLAPTSPSSGPPTAATMYEKRALSIHWIVVCLRNFLQLQPVSLGTWCLSILFLSVSQNHYLHRLASLTIQGYPRVERDVFNLASLSFLTHTLVKASARLQLIDALAEIKGFEELVEVRILSGRQFRFRWK